jgi:DnaJ-domain-containing protein 1
MTQPDAETSADGITARYTETDTERVLEFESDGGTAAIAQNRDGYAMLKVRPTADGDELERYYGFEMALDHAAELVGVSPNELPVPDEAADMGM